MPYPPAIHRLHNFARAQANGDDIDAAKIDAEQNRFVSAYNQLLQSVRAITTASGRLRFSTALREMDMIEELTATGVAGASQVVTVAAYDITTDRVRAFQNGVRLDPTEVDPTSSTTVTLTPAGGVGTGDKLVVEIFSDGAGAMTTLGLATAGNGASLVGIEDAGGQFTSANVEGALVELVTALEDFIDDVGSLATIVRTDVARTMAVDLTFSASKTIKGLRASAANGEAVRHEQIQAAALLASLLPEIATSFLSLAGGTMSGALDMAGNLVNNVADGVDANDAVNKGQLDLIQETVTATLSAPPGLEAWFAGPVANIPEGWLHEDGSEVSRTTYANLYAAIGDSWGVGDGSTTFNLPDRRGKVTAGAGSGTLDKVTGTTIDAGGTGYATVPTLTFTGGGGLVQATAVAEVSGGAIVTVRLLTRGSGYTSAPTIVITGGGGSGGVVTASVALTGRTLGTMAGEESHIQTDDEVGRHTHGVVYSTGSGDGPTADGTSGSADTTGTPVSENTGGEPFNVMQPTVFSTPMIKT
jgi:microcystin-dependent protein